MLVLPIKRQWFKAILSGDKKEEYREIKPYYTKRFQSIGLLDSSGAPTGNSCIIAIRNGYRLYSPTARIKVALRIGEGKTEWGAEHGTEYYILSVEEISEVLDINLIPEGPYCHKGANYFCPYWEYIKTVKLHVNPPDENYEKCECGSTCDNKDKCWQTKQSSCQKEVYRCRYMDYTDYNMDTLLWDCVKECGIKDFVED